MEFWKLHGAGNDFIIIDDRDETIGDTKRKSLLAEKVCHRHFGIGADGFMAIRKSDSSDVRMEFYNSDGTVANMCGNGIRCFAKLVYDLKIVQVPIFSVETGAGNLEVKITDSGNKLSKVKINMGSYGFNPHEDGEITILDETFHVASATVGVPHCVIFSENTEDDFVIKYGSILENHPRFADGTNANFVKILDDDHVLVSTWEKGVGKTLACGTGACAAALIGQRDKSLKDTVSVEMPGGAVVVTKEEASIYMEGPAELICRGEYND